MSLLTNLLRPDWRDRLPELADLPAWLIRLTEAEIAYIAGLLDGEGSIGVHIDEPVKRPGRRFVLRVSITNTYYPVMEWLHEKIGGTHLCYQPRHGNYKPIYTLQVKHREARLLLACLRPYLRIKHRQADVVLQLWGGIDSENRRPISVEEGERRLALALELRALNKTGPSDEST